jgi:hypothetical protein
MKCSSLHVSLACFSVHSLFCDTLCKIHHRCFTKNYIIREELGLNTVNGGYGGSSSNNNNTITTITTAAVAAAVVGVNPATVPDECR